MKLKMSSTKCLKSAIAATTKKPLSLASSTTLLLSPLSTVLKTVLPIAAIATSVAISTRASALDMAGLQRALFGNVNSTVTSNYGVKNCNIWPTNIYWNCQHPALDIADIAGPVNTPIYSPIDGVVVRRTDDNGFIGIYNQKSNTTFFFGHMNRTDVVLNQNVTKGQQVGIEGTKGYATGRHLHFEARPGKTSSLASNISQTVNPLDAVNSALSGTTPVSGQKTYFIGSYALNTNNYFSRIDGFPIMSSWTRNDSDPDQQFERLSGNWGTLLKHKSTGACLNAHYLSNGSQINVWSPCSASDPDQNWTFPDLGGGYFHIKRANTNFCVDMPYRTNGGRIHLIQCDPNNGNQRWRSN